MTKGLKEDGSLLACKVLEGLGMGWEEGVGMGWEEGVGLGWGKMTL